MPRSAAARSADDRRSTLTLRLSDRSRTPRLRLVASASLTEPSRAAFLALAGSALEEASASGAEGVLVDLAAVREIDASGLGALVMLLRRAEMLELSLALERVPESVSHMLRITNMMELFEIAEG
jgi:anti-anti-sigma factor